MEKSSPSSSQRLHNPNIQPIENKSNDEIDHLKKRQKPPSNDKIKKKKHLLSFGDQIDEANSEKIRKNPEAQLSKQLIEVRVKPNSLEQKIKEQYLKQTQKIKEQLFQFEYSYWDGPNTIKKLIKKKKQTITQLLQDCRLELIQNFQHLAKLSASQLFFVIKDFIAPLEMKVYQIEALELKTTKQDPLFNFQNVKIKKDGKQVTLSVNFGGPIRIIEKSRYQKNKTTYPFCNWHTISYN